MATGKRKKPRTVRVRIAVVTAEGGEWCACGSDADAEPEKTAYECIQAVDARDRLSWVVADVPLPEPEEEETLEGKVEE